jgi:ACT domain-containing protein
LGGKENRAVTTGISLKRRRKMKKTIITVVGKDSVGIIARVCTYLAENNINILDISQTIVSGYFNMMMIVDGNQTKKEFQVWASDLEKIGTELSCTIKVQHEDIFNKMHRI